ncbi:ABC transporter ATP-binding protein [Macrococcus hajekii]|uniref:ABC transporter ATP-binding protein n=1 Tax=Macrococcus hajekii TaxID=198482 RepID=A0A4R6BJA4_9STAP|nr:ABC transporter ATP-binding protein [Macrococcus hajekii]TDM01779.1 ABC transporter ATP-binding protein [Macrococcus hajekii]GGB07361.1 dipeptide transport ATP-binding protein DppD [Macrococcus hajekii]
MTALLTVDNLEVQIKKRKSTTEIIKGVSFSIEKGEIFALVGESGSGKSMTTQAISGMLPRNIDVSADKLVFNDRQLNRLKDKEWTAIRGTEIGMVFQDPMTSLNPTVTIGKQLMEIFTVKKKMSKKAAREQAIRLLEDVEIALPEARLKQYPHELSGGMRQRVLIAMAVALSPQLIIADEPTTALDVTTQKQILNLLYKLKEQSDSAVLLITHDLGVVAEIADKVGIMYSGRIVETGTVEDIFHHPKHPYTIGLLSSLVGEQTDKEKPLHSIKGTPPQAGQITEGCPFASRCPLTMSVCLTHYPPAYQTGQHSAHCWLLDDRAEGARVND